MKSIHKIGMLVLLLVVPILVYLFLRSFGHNHYRLPIYFPLETNDVNASIKAGSDTIYHTIPGFHLSDQTLRSRSLQSYLKKVWVADFFFTRCPGICPQITNNLLRVQESFISDTNVQIVSFSVDAEFDQPQILKRYAEKYGIVDSKWQLETGKPIDIYNLGFYGFKLPADTVDKTLHSEKVILVDKQARIRGYYTGTDKNEIDRLIAEIKVLEYEYANAGK